MELKQGTRHKETRAKTLLIVPYGIETALSCQCGDVEQGF